MMMTLVGFARAAADIGEPDRALAAIAEAERYAVGLPHPDVARAVLLRVKADALLAAGRPDEAFATALSALVESATPEPSVTEQFEVLDAIGRAAAALP
jgi:hypothetical protein